MAVANEQHDNGVGHRLPDDSDDERFGSRLRRERLARGWSQHRLIHAMRAEARRLYGRELPSDRSLKAMISRWENNWRVPDGYNQRMLAATLGMSVDELVGRAGDPEPPSPMAAP
jgi:transcriptional regulator with XRE-family HTH domain